jgi:magnesium transporter
MLRVYTRDNEQLVPRDIDVMDPEKSIMPAQPIPWLDLYNPTPQEDRFVEQIVGISIPTREEMQEIEVSSRLYNENGAEFMTFTSIVHMDMDDPMTSPVTLILKDTTLITVRYAEPRPFLTFAMRAQRPGTVPCSTGEQIMIGLIEALIDRLADALERVGLKIEAISREVFHHEDKKGRATKSRDFQKALVDIGREGDLLSMIRESLVSLNRVLTYHAAVFETDDGASKESRARVRTNLRDITSLTDHTSYLTNKINFMLDATLGLINLEQNQIIKIFSIAAVCLMPPTLVASIYGMNFKHMPELDWEFGYPMAIVLMVIAALVPVIYFRKRGWL